MNCAACREALSARLDGEDEARERALVEAHLVSCDACRRWFDDAATVTRLARTAPADTASPGVAEWVLEAAPTRRLGRTARAFRWVLGGLGLAQLVLSFTQITELARQAPVGGGQMASAGHLWHESAAWNLALGAGFVWIATRRARPASIVPVLSVFVAALALLSLDDLVSGRVQGMWLLSHGFVLAGYAIILLLTRPSLDFADPPARSDGERPTRPAITIVDTEPDRPRDDSYGSTRSRTSDREAA